ncbi:MAG: group I intron-associated PD-(D/E)XK endonuclease, partial [Candidatus Sulfotelmatobacter sp.]
MGEKSGPKDQTAHPEQTPKLPHPDPALSAVEGRRSKAWPGELRARRHELNTKRRGELAELAFTLKAASLGLGVSKPYGDSERYDVIVDPRSWSPRTSILDRHLPIAICHPEDDQPTS